MDGSWNGRLKPGDFGYIDAQEAIKMVKGINRRVIVVQSPEPKIFEQAIFILKDGVEGVTDEALLREARNAAQPGTRKKHRMMLYGAFWAVCGAAVTGLVWLVCVLV